MKKEIDFKALYIERDKLVKLLSSFKFFGNIELNKQDSVDLNKNSAKAKEVFKRIELRKKITELNKQVNDFLSRYADTYPLECTSKGMRISFFREDLIKKFVYISLNANGNWLKKVFLDKDSKYQGKFYDSLSSSDMIRFIDFLKFYIDATKTKNRIKSPIDAMMRAYIETASNKHILEYVSILPNNCDKYLEAKIRLSEINKILKTHNKPIRDDLQKGTVVDSHGQIHLFEEY